ncbi:hypothetical protein SGLAM104S_06775 [Streptomyces glaucescens]
MLKYEDVVDAPVAKLKDAVDDWSEMAKKLEKLAKDAADGMRAKADRAAWEGVNAGVTKAFIGKTAKEFEDAVAEAKGVRKILEEGYVAIKKAKDDLVNIRDHEGPAAGIRVDGKGKVAARNPLSESGTARHDPDYSKLLQDEKRNIESWQKKIDTIVDNCNDTDLALKRVPSRPTSLTARTSALRSTRTWTRRRPPAPPLWQPRARTSRTRNSSSSTNC